MPAGHEQLTIAVFPRHVATSLLVSAIGAHCEIQVLDGRINLGSTCQIC